MKRIALLTVLLLVVGLSLGFAQEFKPSVAWSTSGSATLTWGIDLDNGQNGFTNAGSAAFTLTLVPAVTLSKGADAPVYGWIQLATTALTISDTGTIASGATAVTAKIVAKPIEIGINGAPALTTAKVTPVEKTADKVLNAETALTSGYSGPGTWVGYVSDMFSVYGKVVSSRDWMDNSAAPVTYTGGVDGSLAFKPVTLGFGFYDGFWAGAVPAAYVSAKLDVAPIVVGLAADLNLSTPSAFDFGATVDLTLEKAATLNVMAAFGDNFNGLDLKAKLAVTAVTNLTETLTVYVVDIASPVVGQNMEYEVINSLSYKVALSDATSVTPQVDVTYGYDWDTLTTMAMVTASLAAALIPNTTVTLKWASGDLLATPSVMGDLTVAVTVAY